MTATTTTSSAATSAVLVATPRSFPSGNNYCRQVPRLGHRIFQRCHGYRNAVERLVCARVIGFVWVHKQGDSSVPPTYGRRGHRHWWKTQHFEQCCAGEYSLHGAAGFVIAPTVTVNTTRSITTLVVLWPCIVAVPVWRRRHVVLNQIRERTHFPETMHTCLLYTSDAADE